MPNWCDNYIKIKGKREEIIKCIEGMNGKKLYIRRRVLVKKIYQNIHNISKLYLALK